MSKLIRVTSQFEVHAMTGHGTPVGAFEVSCYLYTLNIFSELHPDKFIFYERHSTCNFFNHSPFFPFRTSHNLKHLLSTNFIFWFRGRSTGPRSGNWRSVLADLPVRGSCHDRSRDAWRNCVFSEVGYYLYKLKIFSKLLS